jgi:hypothetical protein
MSDDDSYIKELITAAPPLTAAQRDRLSALLCAQTCYAGAELGIGEYERPG